MGTGSPNSQMNLGLAIHFREQGEVQRAEELYRQILEKDPDNATARNRLAGLCLASGRFEEAAVNYEQVIAVLPNDAAVHNDRGIALAQVGKLSEAASSFQQRSASIPITPKPITTSVLSLPRKAGCRKL